MSEGKYGRLPKPKDRSGRVTLSMGSVSLKPTKEAEFEEEGDTYHAHAKRPPAESTLAKAQRLATEFAASASRPWAKLLGDKDDEE